MRRVLVASVLFILPVSGCVPLVAGAGILITTTTAGEDALRFGADAIGTVKGAIKDNVPLAGSAVNAIQPKDKEPSK